MTILEQIRDLRAKINTDDEIKGLVSTLNNAAGQLNGLVTDLGMKREDILGNPAVKTALQQFEKAPRAASLRSTIADYINLDSTSIVDESAIVSAVLATVKDKGIQMTESGKKRAITKDDVIKTLETSCKPKMEKGWWTKSAKGKYHANDYKPKT